MRRPVSNGSSAVEAPPALDRISDRWPSLQLWKRFLWADDSDVPVRKWQKRRRRLLGLAIMFLCCLFILVSTTSIGLFPRFHSSSSNPPKREFRNTGDESFDVFADSVAARFKDKVLFRERALSLSQVTGQRTDEVIYSIESMKTRAKCNAKLTREVLSSALSLHKHCARCDFDVTLIADDPTYSFLKLELASRNMTWLFNRMERHEHDDDSDEKSKSKVFASRKADDLLKYAKKPFVVFMDADVFSNHRSFPESIFDMLHKEFDLVMPIDWAHRHGDLWGRGVPGLCTCLIGFINHSSVTRIFEHWQENNRKMSLMDESDPKRKEWDRLMRFDGSYQHRDQEIFSITLKENAYPDVKHAFLTFEWLCPVTHNPQSVWVEGTKDTPKGPFLHLTQNPCKALHDHRIPNGLTNSLTQENKLWVEKGIVMVGNVDDAFDSSPCGGAPSLV